MSDAMAAGPCDCRAADLRAMGAQVAVDAHDDNCAVYTRVQLDDETTDIVRHLRNSGIRVAERDVLDEHGDTSTHPATDRRYGK